MFENDEFKLFCTRKKKSNVNYLTFTFSNYVYLLMISVAYLWRNWGRSFRCHHPNSWYRTGLTPVILFVCLGNANYQLFTNKNCIFSNICEIFSNTYLF